MFIILQEIDPKNGKGCLFYIYAIGDSGEYEQESIGFGTFDECKRAYDTWWRRDSNELD